MARARSAVLEDVASGFMSRSGYGKALVLEKGAMVPWENSDKLEPEGPWTDGSGTKSERMPQVEVIGYWKLPA